MLFFLKYFLSHRTAWKCCRSQRTRTRWATSAGSWPSACSSCPPSCTSSCGRAPNHPAECCTWPPLCRSPCWPYCWSGHWCWTAPTSVSNISCSSSAGNCCGTQRLMSNTQFKFFKKKNKHSLFRKLLCRYQTIFTFLKIFFCVKWNHYETTYENNFDFYTYKFARKYSA